MIGNINTASSIPDLDELNQKQNYFGCLTPIIIIAILFCLLQYSNERFLMQKIKLVFGNEFNNPKIEYLMAKYPKTHNERTIDWLDRIKVIYLKEKSEGNN